MSQDALDGTVVVSGGRRIGYRLRGPLAGRVVVYLHGSPGSRAEGGFFTDAELAEAGLTMLALDRPGSGLSDPVDEVDLLARAAEIVETCDRLGVQRFAVVGSSAGGTYALATAWLAPEQVVAVVTLSGQARLDTPWAFDGMRDDFIEAWTSADPEADRTESDAEIASLGGPPDEAVALWAAFFADFPADEFAWFRSVRTVFVEDSQELARQGGHGYWIDGLTRQIPWPFTATELRVPIAVFHGRADDWNPWAALQRDLAGAPDLTTTLYDGGKHLSPWATAGRRGAILAAARAGFG